MLPHGFGIGPSGSARSASARRINPHRGNTPSAGDCFASLAMTVAFAMGSRALDKGVHDLLVAGMLEIDLETVIFDLPDGAVAEFLMEHAVADREAANLRHLPAAHRHPRPPPPPG